MDWSNPLDISMDDGSKPRWYHQLGGFITLGCMGIGLLVGLTFVVVVWVSIGRALF